MTERVPLAWISTRACYSRSRAAAYLSGLCCTLFALGPDGAGWLGRVRRSRWFKGLAPEEGDVPEHDSHSGRMVVEPHHDQDPDVFARRCAPFPRTPLATVALTAGSTAPDFDAAVLLTRTLIRRAESDGTRLRVVATVGTGQDACLDRVRALREAGAFVVSGGPDVPDDHLHHFPVRAVIIPPQGELVGVDLADHLRCWPAGGVGELSVLPFGAPSAARDGLGLAGMEASALCLNFHLDPSGPDFSLRGIDAFAARVRQAHPNVADDLVLFTTRDRMDGVTGTVDLLRVGRADVPRRR